ncbi:MAG: dialkylresorcinol condensing enzyme DarA [Flavobacteriales bacterium]|nr:dialkylresorcinol condensing enzyme DarA [Flavobacteriales bacterium]
MSFFDAFPESVGRVPVELVPFDVPPDGPYDLVVLGYTIWFLNPSIPFNSFLEHPLAETYLKGRPVLTVIGARNMWVLAQEHVRRRVAELGGHMVGNISVEDRSPNLVSIITIIRWMFQGKKDPFLMFPAAGIRPQEMQGAARFGEVVRLWLEGKELDLGPALQEAGAMRIKPALLLLEKRATVLFGKYREFILAHVDKDPGSRRRRVALLSRLLPIGAFILSPITAISTRVLSLVQRGAIEAEIRRIMDY